MNGATKAIEDELGITSTDLGLVMSGWYLLYSLFQLPGGWVADRLGSKPALILFAVVWSVLTGLAGLAAGLLGLLLLVGADGGVAGRHLPVLHEGHRGDFPQERAGVRVRVDWLLHEPGRRTCARRSRRQLLGR